LKGTDEQQRKQEVQNIAQNIQTPADLNNTTEATSNGKSINSTNSNIISSSTDEYENGNITSSLIATAGSNFTLDCNPLRIKILQGSDGSITCSVQNKIPKPIELTLECSGLEGTGIECFVNANNKDKTTEVILVREMSERDFSVHMTSSTSIPPPEGLYPFTISAQFQ
jgi:uncharacterized membrane protein